MNPNWPQQEIFCEQVARFAEAKGLVTARGALDLEALAGRFSLTPQTLKQFLQNKKRPRPHFETLAQIAQIIGCKTLEFLDDPGTAPPVVSPDEWAKASEEERAFSRMMFADITADDLTPEEKAEMVRAWKETRDRMLRLKARQEGKPNG